MPWKFAPACHVSQYPVGRVGMGGKGRVRLVGGGLTRQRGDEVVVVGGGGGAVEAEEEERAVVFGRPAEFLGEALVR